MADEGDDDVVRADPAPASEPRHPLSLEEIRQLEDELRPLVGPSPVRPELRAANVAIGIADEIGRIILSFVFVTAILIALALVLTPWLWIAVAVWGALTVVTAVGLARRRRRGAGPIDHACDRAASAQNVIRTRGASPACWRRTRRAAAVRPQ